MAGRYVAMGNVCGVLKVWDLEAEKELWRVPRGRVLTDLSWSPDGRFLAVRGRERPNLRTIIRDAQTGEAVRILDGAGRHIRWSPNGKYLAAVGLQSPHTWVLIWDAVTGAVVDRLDEAPGVSIVALEWSPDSQYLALGIWDSPRGIARIWRIEPRELVREIVGHNVSRLAWRPGDGRYLAAAVSNSNAIRILDVETGDLVMALTGHTGTVNSLKWSPDGRYLATGSGDRTVRLWGAPPRE